MRPRMAILIKKELLKLKWLPISERRDHRLACLAHRALYSTDCLGYLQLKQYLPAGTLRLSDDLQLAVPKEAGTFQYTCAKVFNIEYLKTLGTL